MKGAVEIISILLIVVFAILLVAAAYNYGLPLIQKRQDSAVSDQVSTYFDPSNVNSLPAKIATIANNQGQTEFTTSVSGLWQLYPCADTMPGGGYYPGCGNFGIDNDSISFTFASHTSKVAPDKGWISLSSAACPPVQGNLGSDSAYVVCVRADSTGTGVYNVTYRVWFRPLVDPTGNVYKINLLQHPSSPLMSTGSSVQIIFGDRITSSVNGVTISTTEVKILLV